MTTQEHDEFQDACAFLTDAQALLVHSFLHWWKRGKADLDLPSALRLYRENPDDNRLFRGRTTKEGAKR